MSLKKIMLFLSLRIIQKKAINKCLLFKVIQLYHILTLLYGKKFKCLCTIKWWTPVKWCNCKCNNFFQCQAYQTGKQCPIIASLSHSCPLNKKKSNRKTTNNRKRQLQQKDKPDKEILHLLQKRELWIVVFSIKNHVLTLP